MRLSAPTWPTVILGVACGVLFGALLAIVVNGDDAPAAAQPRTITVAKTVTAPPVTTPGTVIVRTLVPDLVGVQLDVAKQRLAARKFEADVQGGGVFKEMFSTLHVVKQTPKAGTYLEQGSAVRITVG
jgi:hypothetical protein